MLQQRIAELEAALARETAARIQAEKTQRTSEERYRRIVESTPSGICITNEEYLYEYVNPSYCQLYGYRADELIGNPFTLVVPTENHDFMRDLHDRYIAGDTELQGEWQVVARDGKIITILADAARITGEDGRLKKATFVTNITARKQAEDALQRQNAYLHALHEITLSLLRRLTIGDVLKAIVTQAGALLGTIHGYVYLLEPGETTMRLVVGIGHHSESAGHCVHKGEGVTGKVWETRQIVHIPDYCEWAERPTAFVDSRLHAVIGVPLTSGRERDIVGVIGLAYTDPARQFGTYEQDVLERFAALASVALDNVRLYTQSQQEIEERKRVEHELRAAQQQAEAANIAKSAFLSRMSHELRTPLNAILGFVQVMERDATFNPKQLENLGIIKRSGTHLLSLINDVLEISKIEAGRETLNEASFNLHYFLMGLDELFQVRAQQRGLTLTFHRDANVPMYITTDEGKLRQIMMNLLSNAIKFTEHGGVTVTVMAQPIDPTTSRQYLHFSVADTGYGIDEAEIPLVFEAFGQSQSGRKTQEGTGLGLPISQAFVQLMGGEMQIVSTLGKGTTFSFTIQATLADAANVVEKTDNRRVIGLETGQPSYRILVVDDKWENRSALVKLLEVVGFTTREATNGQDAIDQCAAWQPHLIWMDMRMPIMDGYAATKQIKATPYGQAIPIIALTASAFEHERPSILAAGCDDILIKPFQETAIFDKLAKHLKVRFVYDAPAPTPPSMHSTTTAGAAQGATSSTADDMAALPAEVRAELLQAAKTLNTRKVNDLITRIEPDYPALAEELAQMAKSYRFDRILSLIGNLADKK
jgi:PAS domain S-box-containing protein